MKRYFHWRPRRALVSARLSPLLRSWLDTPDSLTARVKGQCRGCFGLQVLAEHWGRPYVDEARRLGVSPRQEAWIRIIALQCDGIPWVLGRTIMPRRSLSGRRGRLRTLGSRPLGTVLFTGREVERGDFEIRRLRLPDPLVSGLQLADHGLALWARRSTLSIVGEPILVTEVFLPELDYGAAYRESLD